MSKKWRKILSALIALAMIVTTYHVSPRAAGPDEIKDEVIQDISKEPDENVEVPKLGELDEETIELDKPNLSEVVRASIVLQAPSTVDAGYSIQNIASNEGAKAYRNSVKRAQAQVTAEIEKAIGKTLDVEWNLTLAANIISANVTRGDIIKISALSSVKKVIIENRYEAPVDEPNTSTTPGMLGADTVAWANGYYGAGSKVMIIDTGTNQNHISFDPEAFEYALTKDGKSLDDYDLLTQADIAAVVDQLNANNTVGKHNIDAASAYKNSKIPFAFNYIDGGYTTDHRSDSQGEHGSHVSGIAAANRYVKQNGEFVPALDSVLAVGMAPDAQILTAKVFGRGGGAYDSDYFAAIEDAIILGADAVNLSLGSSVVGFAISDGYQEIMDGLKESGLVMVTSAGNAYAFNSSGTNTDIPYNYIEDVNLSTGGSPGSYINTLSVASANNIGATGSPLVFNGDQLVFYTETATEYANDPIVSAAGTYDYVLIDGIGEPADYAAVNEAVSLAGKVVMVYRGSLSFSEKGNNALQYKPAAIIIVNNQPGTINMDLSDYNGPVPMVSITYDDGDAIIAASQEGTAGDYTYYTGQVEISDQMQSAVTGKTPTMSDFSSWGGNGSLIMKPEITAPGGDIWSVNGMTDDGYEGMSGTSMAAPHETGMAGLFAQYYRESFKDYVEKAFPGRFTQRQLLQSLMMSTAVPMIEEDAGTYYPVLRQGSGLANIGNAVTAKSFIMMGADATSSYADGKVKAELGQSTDGSYSYSFTIYNPSDYDMIYDLRTDLFTQDFAPYGENTYLDEMAVDMPAAVTYEFPLSSAIHDVDGDGDTDTADIQMILDGASGLADTDDTGTYNWSLADMDGDGEITAYDAYLMLQWFYSVNGEEDTDSVMVPAGQSKTIKVNISTAAWEPYLEYYTSGMWVEGYTFVTSQSISADGEALEVEHSIPLLGFYGSFGESSMFEATSYVDQLYGGTKNAYSGSNNTNYMSILYDGDKKATMFSGNPYAVEDAFPADRLAINSASVITGVHYDEIRAAGTTGWFALEADPETMEAGDTILSLSMGGVRYPNYYYWSNNPSWQAYGRGTQSIGMTAADLGLQEGDAFYAGIFAVPEYYALKMNGGTSSTLTEDEFRTLYASSDSKLALGEGIKLGYTFVVDDTRPVIEPIDADPDSDEITVNFSDNRYVAYVALMDPSGVVFYDGFVPEQTEAGEQLSYTFNKSDYAENNAVTILVADYAGNESAVVIRTGDGEIYAAEESTIFVPTDTMVDGNEYLLAAWNDEEGSVPVARSYGSGYRLSYDITKIQNGDFDEYQGLYIDAADVTTDLIWEAESTAAYGLPGYFMIYNMDTGAPAYLFDNNGSAATFGDDVLGGSLYYNMMWAAGNDQIKSYYNRYLKFSISSIGSVSMSLSTTPANTYLFEAKTVTKMVPFDPFKVSSITLDPESYILIPSIGLNSVAISAAVEPITAEDRSLTWTSSNDAIATVDQNGLVTATGLGVATITAAANDGSGVSAEAVISVVESNPIDAEVNGQIALNDGTVKFVKIDLNNMAMTTLHDASANIRDYPFYGGGRGGNLIWGNDVDNDLHVFDAGNDYAYNYLFAMNEKYAMRDGANYPRTVYTEAGTDYILQMSSVTNDDAFAIMTYDGTILPFDMSDTANLVALAYAGGDDSGNVYHYVLADNGDLYAFMTYPDPTEGMGLRFARIGSLSGFAMGDDPTAYSLTYAAGYTDEDALFLADNNNKTLWYVNLEEMDEDAETIPAMYIGKLDVSNISTLYDEFYDADGGAGIPAAAAHLSTASNVGTRFVTAAQMVKLAPAAEADVPETTPEAVEPPVEVTEVPEEETEVPAEETEAPEEETEAPAEETEAPEAITEALEEAKVEVTEPDVFGGLNSAPVISKVSSVILPKGLNAVVVPQPPAGNPGDNTIVTVSDDVAVNSGKITLSYDPEKLEYVGVITPSGAGTSLSSLFFSVNVDDAAGTISFTYASMTPLAAGETLLEVEFKPIDCEDSDVTVTVNERNGVRNLNEQETVIAYGIGHDWALDSVDWEGDALAGYTKATFTFICQNNNAHVEYVVDDDLEKVSGGSGDTTTITYTAEVIGPDGETYTDDKVVTFNTVYVYGTATVVKVDENDAELPGATFALYADAACTNELATYTAGTAEISALDQGLADYLPPEGDSVTLYLKETEAPEGFDLNETVYELVIETGLDTDVKEDVVTYTITYALTFNGSDTLRVSDKETHYHDWALDSVEWEGSALKGYTKATFTFVCQSDNSHVEYVVDDDLEMIPGGSGDTTTITYAAEVIGPDGKTYTDDKVVTFNTVYVYGGVTLVKVDEDGEELDGAEFALYEDEACTKEVTTFTAGSAQIIASDDFLADYLPEDGGSVTLYLKEIKAPEGFKTDEAVYELVINAALDTDEKEDTVTYTITYTLSLEGSDTLRVTNTAIGEDPEEPPKTGDPSNLPLFITMGGTAAAALAVVTRVRRKKEDADE